mmetsp:Transcript_52392/g.67190  ORF Transcript_52392/g.67190 Transcript_52392/m.67190 type:complete len:94 (+) Transcript_52392:339-620(+)
MMAHTSLGLEDRKEDAYDLHQQLVMNFPDSARFLYRAASYASDVMGKPQEALVALKARMTDLREETDTEKQEVKLCQGLLEHLQTIEDSNEEL